MEKDQLSRKLAVILHADIVGSTALVNRDETLAHKRFQVAFRLFAETIEKYNGIAHEIRGDALVAEFNRASDAVDAALSFQTNNIEYNAGLDDEIRPEVRVGISMGEVIIADGTITGTGVVLAQRLEQVATTNGVVVQGSVADTVPDRLPFEFDDLGELVLKGFDRPVRAFNATLKPNAYQPDSHAENHSSGLKNCDTEELALTTQSTYETLTGEKLDLPEKPSIAVLPFDNMSQDPEQDHFADGMAEDIITVLSRIPDLVVIARNSTFVYKGQAVDVREVGKNLGVGFVLEGSIRKSGNRLRITAQLIDAVSGDHLWAERYDRDADDVFAIQDEITREISIAMSVNLTYGEEIREWAERSASFDTWEKVQKAIAENLKLTPEGNSRAESLARQLLVSDPDFYWTKNVLGYVLLVASRYGYNQDPKSALAEAEALARDVLESEPENGDAHGLLGFILTNQGKHERGIEHGELGIRYGPSVATNYATLAASLHYAADYKYSMARIKTAIRLSPYAQDWFLIFLGDNYRVLGNSEQARTVYEHLANRMPGSFMPLTRLACIYVETGEPVLAKNVTERLLSINPTFSSTEFASRMPYKFTEDRDNFTQAMILAGLPD